MITCTFDDGGVGKLRHVVANTLVFDDGRILLTKRAEHLLEGGKWSLPGGFMNRDETGSEVGKREVLEETGWAVEITNLFCMITYPFRRNENRQNVALCYVAIPIFDTNSHDTEPTDLQWFDLKVLDTLNIAFDHGKIINKYKQYLSMPYTIPLIIESENDY